MSDEHLFHDSGLCVQHGACGKFGCCHSCCKHTWWGGLSLGPRLWGAHAVHHPGGLHSPGLRSHLPGAIAQVSEHINKLVVFRHRAHTTWRCCTHNLAVLHHRASQHVLLLCAVCSSVCALCRQYSMDRYEPKIYALYHTRFRQVRGVCVHACLVPSSLVPKLWGLGSQAQCGIGGVGAA